MSTSWQEAVNTATATSIVVAAALFWVLVIKVVTIPLQQAEATFETDGCDKHVTGAEASDRNCYHKSVSGSREQRVHVQILT